jgi:hypothetical protein
MFAVLSIPHRTLAITVLPSLRVEGAITVMRQRSVYRSLMWS